MEGHACEFRFSYSSMRESQDGETQKGILEVSSCRPQRGLKDWVTQRWIVLLFLLWQTRKSICEYCLMWHYFKTEGNRRWYFLLTGWTVMLRWKSSECGCNVSDVSYFDVISFAKKEMQGADTCMSVVWVTWRAQCYKQLISASSIWCLVFHIFHLTVSSYS